VQSDYGAVNVNPQTGAGSAGGSIKAIDTLAAFGMTMLASIGADPTVITSPQSSAAVVTAALAS
jgi:hypothetical protein